MRCKLSSTKRPKSLSLSSSRWRSSAWTSVTSNTRWASQLEKKTTTNANFLRENKKSNTSGVSARTSESSLNSRHSLPSWRLKKWLNWLRTFKPWQEKIGLSIKSLAKVLTLTICLNSKTTSSLIRKGELISRQERLNLRKRIFCKTIEMLV